MGYKEMVLYTDSPKSKRLKFFLQNIRLILCLIGKSLLQKFKDSTIFYQTLPTNSKLS